MRIGACVPGTKVYYQPVRGVSPWFEGVVTVKPWTLGDGTFVTNLHQLEPAYGVWRNDSSKTIVHAAMVERLRLTRPKDP